MFAYLKVGAVLLSFCRPLQLYVFSRPDRQFVMQEHDIGQDFALYYMAFATYLELRGSFAKAEAVFKAGLERCGMHFGWAAKPHQGSWLSLSCCCCRMAHPVDKLRAKHQDFQHRMVGSDCCRACCTLSVLLLCVAACVSR